MRPVYCDESVWMPVARGLRQREREVYTASEESMLGEPDVAQLDYAVDNDWVFLTFDDDFLGLVEKEELSHRGVIYVDQTGRRVGGVVKDVDSLLRETEDLKRVFYL